ncbi:MAG: SLC13 family permease [Candidatus Nanohalobium sp.]
MFVVTSLITFFTTNDIVILLLTPIIVEICFQARIQNAKLILLTQFIAANTLSMGLLIGSPTNIIIADALRIDFFTYLSLMALPAAVAFTSSLTVLYLTVKITESSKIPLFKDLEFQEEYRIPDENPEPEFTEHMRDWLMIFGFFVVLVAIVTYLHVSLLICAVPSIAISLIYWKTSEKHSQTVKKPLKHLPYGILFFGTAFFTFAEQFSRTAVLNQKIVPVLQQTVTNSPLVSTVGTVYGSGLLVNTFNDLPASALVAQTLPKLELTQATETVITQASLTGLNIGTYLTPVGALAGLIWFNRIREQIRKEEENFPEFAEKLEFPKRTDLVKYGAVHFLLTGLAVGLALLMEYFLMTVL